MATWYYAIGSQSYGPVSDEVIRSLATQGVLGPMASILTAGSASWTALHVHEMSLGLRRTAAGGYVLAAPPASSYHDSGTPPPPPPPGFRSVAPSGYQPVTPSTAPGGAEYAGWWERVAAFVLDFLVLAVPFIIVVVLVIQPKFVTVDDRYTMETETGPAILGQLLINLIGVVYFGLLHSSASGQTMGKLALGIRVVSDTGARLSRPRAMLRYLVSTALASWVAYVIPVAVFFDLLDVLWPLWDSQHQALHDKAVRSLVVRVQHST
jgi:uncharacterized RDD family membrane protein YckC